MNKIKIAFCLRDMQIGGVESVAIRTMEALLKNKNIEISFISYVNITEPVYRQWFEKHPEIKCYSIYPCKWLGTKLIHNFIGKLFQRLLRSLYRSIKLCFFNGNKFNDIDTFIDYYDFGFYKEFKKIKNKKKIAWWHSSINKFEKLNYINRLNNYDKFVVLTDEAKDLLVKKYGKGIGGKVIRIYNPINVKDIEKKSEETIKNLPKNYFCSVTRLSGDKDIKTLLDGFDIFWMTNKKPSVKLLVVGSGYQVQYWKDYASNLKSNKNIVFIGSTNNPYVYMKHSIGHILSSFAEGFGLVLIEAMCCETINISASCNCGPTEILVNGKNGLLFTPGDVKELSDCLSSIWNAKTKVKQINVAAKKSLSRFDIKEITKEIISLIS